MENELIHLITSRRSIRAFKPDSIPKIDILQILEAGKWTPSGLNHQPWKVFVVSDPNTREKLAKCTSSGDIILAAPHVFIIYLDQTEEYNYTKNVQSIGAFFENLLLAIHAFEYGACWLGEIYNHQEEVNSIFQITDPKFEFMGAIAFGIPAENPASERIPIEKFVTFWKE
jgi:nitroreductase